jgi:hypothetical protein
MTGEVMWHHDTVLMYEFVVYVPRVVLSTLVGAL